MNKASKEFSHTSNEGGKGSQGTPHELLKSLPQKLPSKSQKKRRQESLFWQCMHYLGSLQLALVLLAIIAIACALATIAESHFNTKVAHHYIYKAPWFLAWLILLCINLFAVTVTRWPWQRKHWGFVITHYGIILLLIGAAIGLKKGFEGNVTLRAHGSPIQKITTNRSVLEIESPIDNALYLLPFEPIEIDKPTSQRPTRLPIPQTPLHLVIDDWTSHIEQRPTLTPTPDGGSHQAVILLLSNPSSHQEQSVSLSQNQPGIPSHFDFFGLASIDLLNTSNEHPINPEASATPISMSSESKLQESSQKASSLSHGSPGQHLAPLPKAGGKQPPPWLHLFFSPKTHQLHYQLGRGSNITEEGVWPSEKTLQLHWGEWQAKLLGAGTKDLIHFSATPAQNSQDRKETSMTTPLPGIHAFLESLAGGKKQQGAATWIASGDVGTLQLKENVVHIGYGLEMKTVPFSIELLKFEVPRDEGTDRPGDFRATVRFRDLRTGKEKEGLIHMNHPASFPGGLLANMTGYNYKFSQAEWNPQDLSETTLQVLYDPGWLLKWIGSLGICLGIAMMFYFKPKRSTPSRSSERCQPSESHEPSA